MTNSQTQIAAGHPEVDRTITEIRNSVNKQEISKQIDAFIEVISSEGFLDYVNSIGDLPTYTSRREETARTANLQTLEDRGVLTPAGLRLTTREFEFPADGRASRSPLVQVRPGLDPRMGFCVSIGYIVCASFGG